MRGREKEKRVQKGSKEEEEERERRGGRRRGFIAFCILSTVLTRCG